MCRARDWIKMSMYSDLHQEGIMKDKECKTMFECLANNDPDGVMDSIKNQLTFEDYDKTGLGKSTIYHAFREKNPTLRTLAKLISYCNAK